MMSIRSPATNLRVIPAFAFLADFLVLAPVLVPWYEAHGLTATSVFMIQAVFSATMVILEIPSGYIADAWGRRAALVLGAAFWPLGLLLYRFGDSFAYFASAEMVIAIGVSLFSGCMSALLHDSLSCLGRAEEYQRHEGHMNAAARFGTLVASLAGGLLGGIRLALPFEVNIASYLMLTPLALALVEPKRERAPFRKAWSEMLRVARRCLQDSEIRPFILGFAILGTTGRIVIWASLLAFAEWNLPTAWFGAFFALLQLGGVLGGRCSAWLRHLFPGRRFPLLLVAVGPLLIAFGFWPILPMLAVFPLVTFLWNLGLPFFLDGINRRTESRVRATTISVAALVQNASFMLLAPAFGRLVDHLSLAIGYGVLGSVAGAALLGVAWASKDPTGSTSRTR